MFLVYLTNFNGIIIKLRSFFRSAFTSDEHL